MSHKTYVVYDTPLKAWVSSFAGGVVTVLVIGLGVILDSAAMQWVGFVFVLLTAFAWASRKMGRGMTIDEAIKELEQLRQTKGA